jgi:putative flippase GtrA
MLGQFSRFLVVGIFNTAIGYGMIFFSMMVLKLSPELSNVMGYAVGLVFSFVLSKSYTFRAAGDSSTQLIRFLLVFAIAYAANFVTLFVALHYFLWHPVLCQIVAGVIYVICSYCLNSRYVFATRVQEEKVKS